jgi:hypothetical protein
LFVEIHLSVVRRDYSVILFYFLTYDYSVRLEMLHIFSSGVYIFFGHNKGVIERGKKKESIKNKGVIERGKKKRE